LEFFWDKTGQITVPRASLRFFLLVGLLWTAIAVICDYLLLVQIFHPADGYYKLDVYLYYLLTFLLPVVFGKKVSATNSSKYTL
jgi:hypothetical protein